MCRTAQKEGLMAPIVFHVLKGNNEHVDLIVLGVVCKHWTVPISDVEEIKVRNIPKMMIGFLLPLDDFAKHLGLIYDDVADLRHG